MLFASNIINVTIYGITSFDYSNHQVIIKPREKGKKALTNIIYVLTVYIYITPTTIEVSLYYHIIECIYIYYYQGMFCKFYFNVEHNELSKKYMQNTQNFFNQLFVHQVQVLYLVCKSFYALDDIRSTQQKYK